MMGRCSAGMMGQCSAGMMGQCSAWFLFLQALPCLHQCPRHELKQSFPKASGGDEGVSWSDVLIL